MHRGKRLRTIASCVISKLRNYTEQSWDSENAQHNLEITQILRLRGTYILLTGIAFQIGGDKQLPKTVIKELARAGEELHDSLQHTYSAALISRVWTPPVPSAHSCHPLLWH